MSALAIAQDEHGWLSSEVIGAVADYLGESPLFEDWVQAVEEYRREHNTIPDAE